MEEMKGVRSLFFKFFKTSKSKTPESPDLMTAMNVIKEL